MKYLGIEPQKVRVGVFDFTGCEGCELQLANKEDSLLDFLSLLEIVNFREISSDQGQDYDVALVEGSITRADEVERIKDIRAKAKVLVAIGSCACFGGVNQQKNRFELDDVVKEVYGDHKVETDKAKSIADVVEVDLEIPGCPVSKEEVERIVVNVVMGAEIKIPKYPVCVECKQKLNTCVVDLGQICLGPITRAGCDAVCPTGGVGCLGCRGPAEDANYESLKQILMDKGHTESAIVERMRFYGAFNSTVE
ncbi:MAG: NADH:ubiquinone oxidoreductase [Planctomycetota bacterium]|nr:NADH:ubiquinone oxidoreductase [Planctomycetota bacterium]